ncbi:hypothetical protein [Streptomyces beijiangensis]|uniref:L,D-transpeptidase catalytic domain n=2 Tax=Streptomyces TaxID=1883 RepID=A0A939JFW8_9ACTN|nr:hypothetical protein [Streptomyces beijiangensis]MBO0512823.1 hypothetical protein [Streptomyces beijiangensis]
MFASRGNAVRGLQAVVAAGVAVAAVGLLPASAGAVSVSTTSTTSSTSTTSTTKAAAAKSYTYLQFKKNSKDPSNSRLSLVYVQVVNPDKVRTWTLSTWRAGSGLGAANNKIGRNACIPNQGWLPNATYNIGTFYNNHVGTVHGIAWDIGNKRCKGGGKSGQNRTELFVHSEMLSNGKQGTSEPTRWDGNGDYKSYGCIKMKPADVRALKGYRSNYPKPTKLYVS